MREAEKTTYGVRSLKQELLQACKAMLPVVCSHYFGSHEGDRVIGIAERAIARAEKRIPDGTGLVRPDKMSGCFGKVGKHYDFKLRIDGVHTLGREIYLEGEDRLGRRMFIRITDQEEPVTVEAGESVLLRGKILAHDLLFGVPFTFIELTSEITKI
ncbi:MAG TPA: hypothetical protein VFG19_10850 [Geobacteraceae bacterium]|nr:hypothetical protein [Geobacteraceae bacterium]